jgi:hypothetical protein
LPAWLLGYQVVLEAKPKQQANISPNPVVQGDKAPLCNLAADNENWKTCFGGNRRISPASGVTLCQTGPD